jgi:hypothetical protein
VCAVGLQFRTGEKRDAQKTLLLSVPAALFFAAPESNPNRRGALCDRPVPSPSKTGPCKADLACPTLYLNRGGHLSNLRLPNQSPRPARAVDNFTFRSRVPGQLHSPSFPFSSSLPTLRFWVCFPAQPATSNTSSASTLSRTALRPRPPRSCPGDGLASSPATRHTMAANATTSPLATIKFGAASVAPQLESVIDYVANASTWSILATILAVLVVYDQGTLAMSKPSTLAPPADLARSQSVTSPTRARSWARRGRCPSLGPSSSR